MVKVLRVVMMPVGPQPFDAPVLERGFQFIAGPGSDATEVMGTSNGRGPTRIILTLKTLTVLRKSIHPFCMTVT